MAAFVFFIISSSGVMTMLFPASPAGVTTCFSASTGAEAIFYNPANFKAGENYQIWCSYNRFYLSMQSVSLVLTKRIRAIDLGIAFVNFDYGDIEWHPDYPTEDSLTYYTANDFSLVLSGSADITPEGRIGLNLKYISENILIYSGYAFAFDIAFSYRSPKAGISFGASNFGSKITIMNEDVNLPARISLGAFYDFRKFVPSADLHYLVNNGVFEYSAGVDVQIHKIASLNASVHYRETLYPGFGLEINHGKLAIKYGGSIYPRNLGLISTIGVGFEF